jgi:hypothetical protein
MGISINPNSCHSESPCGDKLREESVFHRAQEADSSACAPEVSIPLEGKIPVVDGLRMKIFQSPFIASDAPARQMVIVTICCYIRVLNHRPTKPRPRGLEFQRRRSNSLRALLARRQCSGEYGHWHTFLGDAALTAAIVDRLLRRGVLVEFRGRSYRIKEAASRLAIGSHSKQQSIHSCRSPRGNLTWPRMGQFQVATGVAGQIKANQGVGIG